MMSDSDPTSTSVATLTLEEQALEESTLIRVPDGDGALTIETMPEARAAPAEAGEMAALQVAPPAPAPAPPILPIKRRVAGSYRSGGLGFQLEIRVDVDGYRPMRRVSGDFYQMTGATTSYHSSFRVDAPSITITTTQVVLEGVGAFTFTAAAPKVRVTIPRVSIFQPAAPAMVQFLTLANVPGAIYLCPYRSGYFRSVLFEQDCEIGVTAFAAYDTGLLPSGGPARTLTVPKAYAEAGIGLLTSGVPNVIPVPPGSSWSNAELHAAMTTQFSLWRDIPQWAVWLIAAQAHEIGPGLYGIMFDQQGRQRQGCAVFHQGIGGSTPDKLRLQLYTYVHELGHCFNLLHSWQKGLALPPVPNRPSSLSWMNYPWNYPSGGAAGFWSAFAFQFDDIEVVHLRHAFRNNVIMGGNPFRVGSAIESPEALDDPVEDRSGLSLKLEASNSFGLGEPVVVEIQLRAADLAGKEVNSRLHPNYGVVQIGICKPSGRTMLYEPMFKLCAEPDPVRLDQSRPAIYDSAYIGYGETGIYFDEIGPYRLRALYAALDGSQIVSNVLTLWVRPPTSAADQEVAELLLGEEQGALLYLLGSDADNLEDGNHALDELLERHAKHPLAVYARLVKGMNLARPFKKLQRDKSVTMRGPQVEESVKLLGGVIDATAEGRGVDNITLNQAARYLAIAQRRSGDAAGARTTLDRMVDILRKQSLKPHVMEQVDEQVRSALS
jgi:hypothetical protein